MGLNQRPLDKQTKTLITTPWVTPGIHPRVMFINPSHIVFLMFMYNSPIKIQPSLDGKQSIKAVIDVLWVAILSHPGVCFLI